MEREKGTGRSSIKAWDEGRLVGGNPRVRTAYWVDFTFLQRWAGSSAFVFFDLGETERLLWLLGKNAKGLAYLYQLSREEFVEWHRSTMAHPLDEAHNFVPKWLADHEAIFQAQPSVWVPLRPRQFQRRFRF
jgi:hypothetical protein